MSLVGRELSFSDGPSDIEPSAKRPKMDFLTSSSLWDQIKRHLDILLSKESLSFDDIKVVIRIAVVGARLSLKWKDTGTVFEERNFHKINTKLSDYLLVKTGDDSEETVRILCEYLDGCIPLTYSGIEKMVGTDWLAFSALPWLSTVSCDLDPKWLQIHHDLKHTLLRYQSRFANVFVKYNASFQAEFVCPGKTRNLIIALEPEVASLYCRRLPTQDFASNKTSTSLSPGDKYIVLDAGGKIITAYSVEYTVTDVAPMCSE